MATARDARDWARSTLRGIGNSLYTPFCGDDGDDIDWDAYRTLVRYCVGELKHPMLWCTSGIAEFWSLTHRRAKAACWRSQSRKAAAADPDVVVQACTAATSAKDCLELTRHAQQAGADIVYIQTPMMEAHGGEGVLNFFRYIADRTDIALGMFNSPSSGYVLTPAEGARIYSEIPAVCATKEGAFRPASSRLLHELAPESDDLGVRPDRLPRGLAAGGDRRPRATRHGGLSVRDPAAADHLRVLGAGLERQADRGDGLRREVRAGPVRYRYARRGSPAIPVGRTTSRTGVGRSSTRRRCSVCRSATTRTRARRKPSSPPRVKRRSMLLIAGMDWSPADRGSGCGRHYR